MNLLRKLDPNKMHVVPFGGCSEFGMNATAYLYQRKLYLVDAGILFPDPQMLGVSSILPDFGKLFRSRKPVAAYIITHGHEDHIGAVPYLYERWPAPVYATPWTYELLKRKFEELRLPFDDLHMVKVGSTAKVGPLKVEYIHVNHSIPDAASLYITVKNHKIFHTGDFKIDPTPVGCPPVSLDKLKEVGKKGVDLLIADSTNAHKSGPSPSEMSVKEPLADILRGAKGRVLLTTFASNLWRLKVIADLCAELGKKLAIAGRGMANCLELGKQLGYIHFQDDLIVPLDRIKSVPNHKLVILISGSQGEDRSALTRVARGQHRQLKINEGDLVLFSSRAIPGNEKSIFMLYDILKKQGARVISAADRPDIHVSGHAYGGDLEAFIKCLKPRHYLPVHGTFSHLQSNWKIGEGFQDLKHSRTLIQNGDVLTVSSTECPKVVGNMDIGTTYIDRNSLLPLDVEVASERHRVGEIGALIISGAYSIKHRSFKQSPRVQVVGVAGPIGLKVNEWQDEMGYWLEEKIEQWSEKLRHIDERLLEKRIRQLMQQYCMTTVGYKPDLFIHSCVV
ncbi:MAG: ribonuclease J [Zetaproteobacteria bacterium]|nr:ribonuclease J [Zetaproteobacteria bacterium]